MHIVQKIRLQDFVSDSINPFRDHFRLTYNPDILRDTLAPLAHYEVPNFLEFNHIYRAWHTIIPESLLDVDGEPNVSFHDVMWRPSLVATTPTDHLITLLQNTPQGRYGAHNTPAFLSAITKQTLLDERAQGVRSFNDYREFVGFPRMTSFEEFDLNTSGASALSTLYNGDIDAVEFFVGVSLNTGDATGFLDNNIFGDMQLVMVTQFALQEFVSMKTIQNPELWSDEVLTAGGKSFVQTFDLGSYLSNITKRETPCPFLHTNTCDTSPAYWDEDDYRKLDGDICAFVGVDWLMWYFDSETFHDAYSTVFVVAVVYIVLFCVTRKAVACILKLKTTAPRHLKNGHATKDDNVIEDGSKGNAQSDGDNDNNNELDTDDCTTDDDDDDDNIDEINKEVTRVHSHQMYVTSFLLTIAIINTVLVIPVSQVCLRVLFANDLLGAMEHSSWIFWGSVSISTIAYIGEISLKAGLPRAWMMISHHILFLLVVFFAIAVSGSVLMMKVGLILQTFNMWEFPLYWTFFANRLPERVLPSWVLHTWIIPVAAIVYIVSRCVQAGLLISLYSCGPQTVDPHNSYNLVEYVVVIPCLVFLVVMQASLVLGLHHLYAGTSTHRRMQRAKGNIREGPKRGTVIHGPALTPRSRPRDILKKEDNVDHTMIVDDTRTDPQFNMQGNTNTYTNTNTNTNTNTSTSTSNITNTNTDTNTDTNTNATNTRTNTNTNTDTNIDTNTNKDTNSNRSFDPGTRAHLPSQITTVSHV